MIIQLTNIHIKTMLRMAGPSCVSFEKWRIIAGAKRTQGQPTGSRALSEAPPLRARKREPAHRKSGRAWEWGQAIWGERNKRILTRIMASCWTDCWTVAPYTGRISSCRQARAGSSKLWGQGKQGWVAVTSCREKAVCGALRAEQAQAIPGHLKI